jgi:hypothetical protein
MYADDTKGIYCSYHIGDKRFVQKNRNALIRCRQLLKVEEMESNETQRINI